MKKVAVIGSGISGLTASWLLHKKCHLTLFEANHYLGGHTNTQYVVEKDRQIPVDTGFIVFNDKNYPLFKKILDELHVESAETDMSFSVFNQKTGLQYRGADLPGFFTQKRNILNPTFIKMLFEIIRFNKLSCSVTETERQLSLQEFLLKKKFSTYFGEAFLIPMGAAIWSSDIEKVQQMEVGFFIDFFQHHGFLNRKRLQWRYVKGGSATYVKKMRERLQAEIKTENPVSKVKRFSDHVLLVDKAGNEYRYDEVVFACHSDQTLKIIENPTAEEKEILGAIQYQANKAVLHMDESLLPTRRGAWACWNYLKTNKGNEDRLLVSYYMNRLQKLPTQKNYIVSLNCDSFIDPKKVIKEIDYEHPLFDQAAVKAQSRFDEINQKNRSYFCGAYWGYGFHEDGVKSAHNALKNWSESGAA